MVNGKSISFPSDRSLRTGWLSSGNFVSKEWPPSSPVVSPCFTVPFLRDNDRTSTYRALFLGPPGLLDSPQWLVLGRRFVPKVKMLVFLGLRELLKLLKPSLKGSLGDLFLSRAFCRIKSDYVTCLLGHTNVKCLDTRFTDNGVQSSNTIK